GGGGGGAAGAGAAPRRARRADATLTGAHHAQRVARRGGELREQHVDGRDVGGGGHLVLHERDRLRLARLVVGELLQQRPADSLRRAAAALSLGQRGVDGPAPPAGHAG